MLGTLKRIEAFTAHLKYKLKEFDEEEEIGFKQWESADHAKLVTHLMFIKDFKELLTNKIHEFTKHSFISKTQNEYLKQLKETLTVTQCIILVDFTENHISTT